MKHINLNTKQGSGHMKLLYLWVENNKEMIKNQSFNISSSYQFVCD